jgi:hypothetical protein
MNTADPNGLSTMEMEVKWLKNSLIHPKKVSAFFQQSRFSDGANILTAL